MAEYTQNYSLKKPLPNEFYDVADQNSNMDKIDSALKKHDDLLDKKVDLDETGKIPQEQLPELDFIPNSEKGQPNGVPILDEHGKIPADNMPANTPTLGEDGKIPQEQLPELNFDTAGSAATVQGNLNAHINNKQNPHGVTAAQVGAYDKNQSLTSVTAGLFGLSASAVPNDVLVKIKTLIDSANENANSRVIFKTGSYIGTGTAGKDNPNSLVVDPRTIMLIIRYRMSSSRIYGTVAGIFSVDLLTSTYSDMAYIANWDEANVDVRAKKDGNTIFWYDQNDYSTDQLNISGTEYKYIEILSN